ncbi:MoaD/ThiS family protein [Qipengyuania sp. 1NDH17]|uniref:MoaD/ThiS family protein n=1 Tax=Qipengyuania polymorpha TaxID=2867234 RepID=A0ABS7ITX5_9SPHN|nr:MoaD/ThiS family protein [Qipengyuania polymorpha]
MSVTLLFLGPLRDLAGEQEREVASPLDWAGLIEQVGPKIAAQLEDDRVNIACKGKVLADKRALIAEDGDEVALLPPVSGG